jgi:hypothetical protein
MMRQRHRNEDEAHTRMILHLCPYSRYTLQLDLVAENPSKL